LFVKLKTGAPNAKKNTITEPREDAVQENRASGGKIKKDWERRAERRFGDREFFCQLRGKTAKKRKKKRRENPRRNLSNRKVLQIVIKVSEGSGGSPLGTTCHPKKSEGR